MGEIFEWQVDPKTCKYYIDAFDVIFVDDEHHLRFGRYCKPVYESISGKYNMAVKDNSLMVYNIDRNRALCFYDIDKHRWCSKVDDHRYKCWEVIAPEDDKFINVLVGIAIDELTGSKTCLSVDDITHRIKSRFSIWYDEYTSKPRISWDGRNTIKVPDNFFDDTASKIEHKIKIRNGKPNPTTYQLPQPKFVQINGIFTTVVWKDGTHTVVKLHKDEHYDIQTAVLYATIKRMCANNGCEMDRYLSRFGDHVIFKKETDHDKKDNSEDNN